MFLILPNEKRVSVTYIQKYFLQTAFEKETRLPLKKEKMLYIQYMHGNSDCFTLSSDDAEQAIKHLDKAVKAVKLCP